MNKKLKTALATALLGSSMAATAAPQMEMWGWLHQYMETDRVKGCEGDVCNPGLRNSSFISKIGLKVTEPLNDVDEGLKFIFRLDTAYFSDAPDEHQLEAGPRSRDIQIGDEKALAEFNNWDEGGYKIAFGRDANTVWKNIRSIAPMGDLHSTILGEIHERQKLRFSNGTFAEFKLGGGLELQMDYSLGESDSKEDKWGGGLNYRPNKDWRFTYAYVNLGQPSAGYTIDDESHHVTASYYGLDTWKFTVMASDDQYKDVDRQGTSFHAFKQISDKWSAGAVYGHRDNPNTDGYQLGLNYHLTKNLQIQARGAYTKADDTIRFTTPDDLGGLNGDERTNIGIGLEFKF